MTSVTKRPSRAKASRTVECKILRTVELVEPLHPGWGFATLRYRQGKDDDLYTASPVRSEIGGRGFEVTKQGLVEPLEDGTGHYYVLVHGEESSCECRG